jgi:hypothetical protein
MSHVDALHLEPQGAGHYKHVHVASLIVTALKVEYHSFTPSPSPLPQKVVIYAPKAQPTGIFHISLDAVSLPKRVTNKIKWDEVAFSTSLSTGGPGLPQVFDLVASYTEASTGNVRTPKSVCECKTEI